MLALSALLGLLGGCNSKQQRRDRWDDRVFQARRMQDTGRLDEAERQYRKLLDEAESRRDRRYLRLQLARLAADRKDYRTAIERYRSLWRSEDDDMRGARALTEAAVLLDRELDEPERARSLWRKLVREHPRSTGAERALQELADHYAERESWDALCEEFETLYTDVEETPLADDVLFHVAITLERRAGRTSRALEYYDRIIRNHPSGDMIDDTEWQSGRIYARRQNWRRATKVLGRLAERVKGSWLIGSFNSPYASKARFKLGFIHLTHLGDYDAAVAHFDQYLQDFPRNRKADDAAWHRAQAYRLKGEPEAHRRALRDLIEAFPKSRYVPRAREALDGSSPASRSANRDPTEP